MKQNIIPVNVSWAGDNFGCSWDDGHDGAVIVTAKSIDKLKKDFEESLRLHIRGCVSDGDAFPEYMINGNYEIVFNLDAAALI